jgi:hypothetical protein
VLGWTLLMHAAALLIGAASGLSALQWEIYGDTVDEAVANALLVRRIAVGVAAALLYCWFTIGVPARRLLHFLGLIVLVQATDLALSLALGNTVDRWLDPWSIGRSLLAAAAGYTVARAVAGNSREPVPSRDPARATR